MNDLTIELKAGYGECLYQQIYEYIKNEIREGKLHRDEKLPSTRSLAEYLQVARSTVESAYDQLLAEGYIQSKPYRGYFVCNVEELYDLGSTQKESGFTRPLKNDREENSDKESIDQASEILYNFSPHSIDMKYFPYATWKRITKEILVDANSEMFALGSPMGDLKLRETICRYLHSARGVNCRPEQVIIGAGSDYLLLLLEKIFGEKRKIAMEIPTYTRATNVFRSFGYQVCAVSMDESGMKVDELEKSGANIAYVMPSHQYPTGVVMPIGRRMELLKWAAADEGRFLIEDDYDSEFRYKGKPIPSLQASDHHGKVIYMGTFSKSIAPAIRVGYMVLPLSLLEQYQKNCGFYASTVSRIDQRILNEFIGNGYYERYLNKMRKIYREKHDLLMEELKEFESGFSISGEHAGLHILLTSKKNIPEEELVKRAKDYQIKLYGLSEGLSREQGIEQKNPSSTVLLGYGAFSTDELKNAMSRLKKAFQIYL